MFFLSNHTKAKFYNKSRMTFFVQRDCVDIIFKIKRGVYLTVSVYSLSDDRLLLACAWGEFWNRLKYMQNSKNVLMQLKKACPLAGSIFMNVESPHFSYIDKEQREGTVVLEMIAPVQMNSVVDYLHEKVQEKAIELMTYNLNLLVELEEKCPFPLWKEELENMR